MIELNTIYNEDCLETMKRMPDGFVDLVLTDPPYGDGGSYGRFGKTIANNEDESINYRVIPELHRVLKSGGGYVFVH